MTHIIACMLSDSRFREIPKYLWYSISHNCSVRSWFSWVRHRDLPVCLLTPTPTGRDVHDCAVLSSEYRTLQTKGLAQRDTDNVRKRRNVRTGLTRNRTKQYSGPRDISNSVYSEYSYNYTRTLATSKIVQVRYPYRGTIHTE